MTADISASTLRVRPPLYQPDSAVFWLFVTLLTASTIELVVHDGPSIAETINAEAALSGLWLAFTAFLVWLLLRFDPFRSVRAYPQVLAAGCALGGTVAIGMAREGNATLSTMWSRVLPPDIASAWDAALCAPFVEETAKAFCAAVILVLASSVFNRISHALLLGMFVGLGFGIIEDLEYNVDEAISSLDSDIAGALISLALRALTAVPAHWAYTALATVGVLLLLPTFAQRQTWSVGRRIITAVALISAAMFMHFFWDSPLLGGLGLVSMVVKMGVNLAIFLAAVFLLLRSERAWIRSTIRTRTDVSYPRELVNSLPTLRQRRAYRRAQRKEHGRAAGRAARRDQKAALDALQRPPAPQPHATNGTATSQNGSDTAPLANRQ
ncbi:PrsW family intramembrane metalloprotease [Mycolicibacterium obuense]|uniref:PrsW family intramembrane metalloprotease n=1 Tax=Mycolicibacterium obuense TaxID=1807 RepID=A0A0J6VTK7_9MYCO|nr:PrsW family intramembrane metalloprotease [Mycolicibacterium obuense]KMO73504.1 hypothetical protein MOBUDSM44075_03836 [Mycolicibacterium obuense]